MRKVHQMPNGRAKTWGKVCGTAVAVALLATACGGDDDEQSSGVGTPTAARVDVGSDSSTAARVVAEIYAQALENSGLRVGRKAEPVIRAEALADLAANTLQVYPDFIYSLLTHLEETAGGTVDLGAGTTDAQVTAIGEALPDTVSLGDPSSADNGLVFACSASVVEERSLTTVTELFEQSADITLGGPAEFEDASPFGLAGFAADDVEFAEFVALGEDEIGAAVGDGTVDCGVLSGLSSDIVDKGLLVLDDESSLAPENALAPLVATPANTPDVATLLSQVDTLLTTEILRSLVVKVEIGGESVEQVAKAFIASQGSSSQ